MGDYVGDMTSTPKFKPVAPVGGPGKWVKLLFIYYAEAAYNNTSQ